MRYNQIFQIFFHDIKYAQIVLTTFSRSNTGKNICKLPQIFGNHYIMKKNCKNFFKFFFEKLNLFVTKQ